MQIGPNNVMKLFWIPWDILLLFAAKCKGDFPEMSATLTFAFRCKRIRTICTSPFLQDINNGSSSSLLAPSVDVKLQPLSQRRSTEKNITTFWISFVPEPNPRTWNCKKMIPQMYSQLSKRLVWGILKVPPANPRT